METIGTLFALNFAGATAIGLGSWLRSSAAVLLLGGHLTARLTGAPVARW
jgi:hypothetical protein